jgi:hypothetical protein
MSCKYRKIYFLKSKACGAWVKIVWLYALAFFILPKKHEKALKQTLPSSLLNLGFAGNLEFRSVGTQTEAL